jgi:hypothetical protein
MPELIFMKLATYMTHEPFHPFITEGCYRAHHLLNVSLQIVNQLGNLKKKISEVYFIHPSHYLTEPEFPPKLQGNSLINTFPRQNSCWVCHFLCGQCHIKGK